MKVISRAPPLSSTKSRSRSPASCLNLVEKPTRASFVDSRPGKRFLNALFIHSTLQTSGEKRGQQGVEERIPARSTLFVHFKDWFLLVCYENLPPSRPESVGVGLEGIQNDDWQVSGNDFPRADGVTVYQLGRPSLYPKVLCAHIFYKPQASVPPTRGSLRGPIHSGSDGTLWIHPIGFKLSGVRKENESIEGRRFGMGELGRGGGRLANPVIVESETLNVCR